MDAAPKPAAHHSAPCPPLLTHCLFNRLGVNAALGRHPVLSSALPLLVPTIPVNSTLRVLLAVYIPDEDRRARDLANGTVPHGVSGSTRNLTALLQSTHVMGHSESAGLEADDVNLGIKSSCSSALSFD